MKFVDYMKEEKPVSRLLVLRIAIIGAFAGAALAVAFMFVSTAFK